MILKDWVEGNDSYLASEGWVKAIRLPSVTGRGTCTMWHRPGAISGNQMNMEGLGKMTVEHFVCVVQMESYLVSKGIKCSSDHNQGADLTFEINGKMYAIEYEMGRSHTEEQLIEKKGRLLGYDDFRFVCSSDDYNLISSAVSEEYTTKRGKDFVNWIEGLFECSFDNEKTGEEMVCGPIGAL